MVKGESAVFQNDTKSFFVLQTQSLLLLQEHRILKDLSKPS